MMTVVESGSCLDEPFRAYKEPGALANYSMSPGPEPELLHQRKGILSKSLLDMILLVV